MELLILLAILPSYIIAYLIYKSDKKEKEPKRELVKAFLLGIVSVVITLVISYVLGINSNNLNSTDFISVAIYSFLGISLIEEFSKWICLCVFLKKNKNFDYLFDGIVYSVFVALGFATVENIIYTLVGGVSTGIMRAITTVPAHAFFGISSGYFISLAKQEKYNTNRNKKYYYVFLSLLLPFLLHGFYNFCLLTQNYMLFIVYIIFVVSLYSFSIYQVKKMMKMEKKFKEEDS